MCQLPGPGRRALDRLKYLSVGLGVVLAFIGAKLVMEALHANKVPFIHGGQPITWLPEVPTWLSLAAIDHLGGGHHGEPAQPSWCLRPRPAYRPHHVALGCTRHFRQTGGAKPV
jgi:hypothetical protein